MDADWHDGAFREKARWHEAQRRLTPKQKVAIVIALQRRERDLGAARAAAGVPVRIMTPWNTEP